MPTAAPKPCAHPACGALVYDGSGYCARHAKEAWAKSPNTVKRVTGRKLQRWRKQLFAEQPLCAECVRRGRVALATQRDHIVPLAEGGKDEPENVQGLCKTCHDAKSQVEALRARRGGGSRS